MLIEVYHPSQKGTRASAAHMQPSDPHQPGAGSSAQPDLQQGAAQPPVNPGKAKPQQQKGAEKEGNWWHSDSSSSDNDPEDWELDEPQNKDELYDPDADDKDLEWVHKQRKGRKTDAILSCPCCFTTLCIDCQQHAQQQEQYRAMFTMNCKVDKAQLQEQPSSKQQGRSRGKQARTGEQGAMWCVVCEVCDTVVGAQDEDEVVHFYHVLASNA